MPMMWPMWRTLRRVSRSQPIAPTSRGTTPGAEQKVAAVVAVETEPLQVVERFLVGLAVGVGGERFRMRGQHGIAQALVVGEVGRRERPDDDGVAHPPM